MNISHQIKTPLTSLMIMVDLLETVPPDKQTEFLTNIKAGLAHMDWLTSTLLKIAKLDVGTIEFLKESIQSDALINFALEPLQIFFEVKNQSVYISESVELICDKRWTSEAITNSVKNASEASPEGSMIRIESGLILFVNEFLLQIATKG